MFLSAETIRNNNLIEKRFFHLLNEKNQIIEKNSNELLTPNRFDISIKLSYLRHKNIAPQYAIEIYADHILAFGGGRYCEPEKKHKDSLAAFTKDFASIEEKIKENGFDEKESLIPLAKDGSILNGAHRVAAAIFHNKPVKTIILDIAPSEYDYKFFADRHTPWNTLLAGLQEFSQRNEFVRIAMYWPAASQNIEYRPKNIIAELTKSLTLKEFTGLIRQVYRDEPWLGHPGNNYEGALHKAKSCYAQNIPLKAFVFLASPNLNLIELKDSIRQKLNLGKHSLHISDYMQDTIQVVNFLFNENSINFLSLEDTTKFSEKDRKVKKVFDAIKSVEADIYNTAIDSSMVMEICGLRKSFDIDVISIEKNEILEKLGGHGIDSHNHLFIKNGFSIPEIICNPKHHFWYNSIKIVTIDILKEFKKRRGEPKDINDIEIIETLSGKSKLASQKAKLKQHMFYIKFNTIRNTKKITAKILRSLGILDMIKKLLAKKS